MQTFLPYPDYKESARCLDRQRLGKQRIECKQILRALLGETSGWQNHPATKMWSGHEAHLCDYAIAICEEWIKRGYKDQQLPFFKEKRKTMPYAPVPKWLGDYEFHASHRSKLLAKKPEWYSQFGWTEPNDLPYVWPTKTEKFGTRLDSPTNGAYVVNVTTTTTADGSPQ